MYTDWKKGATLFLVSRHQKGKPFCILLSEKDGVAVASAGLYANHLHLAPDR